MAQKKSCTDAVNLYEDVIKCPGQKRLPGTRAYGWFIRRAYITKLAEPQKEAAAALKDYLVIKDSHTLRLTKSGSGLSSFQTSLPWLLNLREKRAARP